MILLVVLMLFGSKSIPSLARGLGKGMKEVRNASNEIRRDIQQAGLEMRKDLNLDDSIKEFTTGLEEDEDIKKGLSVDLEEPTPVEELDDLAEDDDSDDEDDIKQENQTDSEAS